MAHVGQKLALGPAGGFSSFLSFGKLNFSFLARGIITNNALYGNGISSPVANHDPAVMHPFNNTVIQFDSI